MFIPNARAQQSLASKLNLKFDNSTQDWEYEVADKTRLQDFIDEYEKSKTSDDEMSSLMEIILDSLNDLLVQNGHTAEFKKHLAWVKNRLPKEIHADSLIYWKMNSFEISKFL